MKMYRLWPMAASLAITSALMPAAAVAQQVGVTGGFNSAILVFSPDQERVSGPDRQSGFMAGAFMTYQLHRRADIRIEALVSQKGVKEIFRFGDDVSITDFELPVLVQLKLHQPDTSGAHLFVGPTVAFTMTASYQDGEGFSEDFRDDLDHTVDVGLTVGGGVMFGRISIDARYTLGFLEILTDGDSGAALKNRTVSISAGVVLWRRR